jgi:hypothetical protein
MNAKYAINFCNVCCCPNNPNCYTGCLGCCKANRQELSILGILIGVIQCLDGFIGIYQAESRKSIEPFVLTLLQFIALLMMNKKEEIKTGTGN